MYYLIAVFGTLFVYTVINIMAKNKKPLKRAFLSMFSGLLSLILVNIIGIFCNTGVTVSPFSITVASCGGVPAVIAMVVAGTFL